jgi:hypothetical protein
LVQVLAVALVTWNTCHQLKIYDYLPLAWSPLKNKWIIKSYIVQG